MRRVQSSDAKARFSEILDDVERGETIVITRHGKDVARLAPEVERRQDEIDAAIENIKRIQKQTGRITLEELLSARHEGHKH